MHAHLTTLKMFITKSRLGFLMGSKYMFINSRGQCMEI